MGQVYTAHSKDKDKVFEGNLKPSNMSCMHMQPLEHIVYVPQI